MNKKMLLREQLRKNKAARMPNLMRSVIDKTRGMDLTKKENHLKQIKFKRNECGNLVSFIGQQLDEFGASLDRKDESMAGVEEDFIRVVDQMHLDATKLVNLYEKANAEADAFEYSNIDDEIEMTAISFELATRYQSISDEFSSRHYNNMQLLDDLVGGKRK